MENPTLPSTTSSTSPSNSPEFEFSLLSYPETLLHSADELFSGGLLLPLHQLNNSNTTINPSPNPPITTLNSEPISTILIPPKRWKDIFIKNPEKKKKDKNGGAGGTAELNINLWPFSRSKSAGNSTGSSGGRPRTPALAPASCRKVSSAPCSRSNSAGESKSKKWQSSPNRGGGGVHVGRSSPVWQIKRVGSGRSSHDNLVRNNNNNAAEKGGLRKERTESSRRSKKSIAGAGDATVAGAKTKVLNLNVQTCIGYRHHLSCRSDEIQEDKSIRVAGENVGVEMVGTGVLPAGEGPRDSNMLNLRNLFAKKVY